MLRRACCLILSFHLFLPHVQVSSERAEHFAQIPILPCVGLMRSMTTSITLFDNLSASCMTASDGRGASGKFSLSRAMPTLGQTPSLSSVEIRSSAVGHGCYSQEVLTTAHDTTCTPTFPCTFVLIHLFLSEGAALQMRQGTHSYAQDTHVHAPRVNLLDTWESQ